jgi:GTP-binding protein EngB required for normal cell division
MLGEGLLVRYLDGHRAAMPLTAVADLVTESGNPANVHQVSEVEIILKESALANHPVEVVDTPGVGSVFAHNTAAAQQAYQSLDAVVVVLTADPPITASDRDLLAELAGRAVRTFIVINKADRFDEAELAEAVAFTGTVLAAAGVTAEVWPLSARERDQGYVRFEQALHAYLRQSAESDAARALAGHARRIATRLRDQATVEARAAELAAVAGQDRVHQFARRLDALTARGVELDDICDATRRRLLGALTESAHDLVHELGPRSRKRATETFEAAADAAPEDAAAAARAAAVADIVDAVEDWRSRRAALAETELQAMVDRLNAEVGRQLDDLRDAAREHLGVELGGEGDAVTLDAGRGFWYATEPGMGWELPGAELIHRHGPGARGRARSRLLEEVLELADRQVGRARSDLQQRIADTVRAAAAQLRRGHRQVIDQLSTAVARAEHAAAGDAVNSGEQVSNLRARIGRLDTLIISLQALADSDLERRPA